MELLLIFNYVSDVEILAYTGSNKSAFILKLMNQISCTGTYRPYTDNAN